MKKPKIYWFKFIREPSRILYGRAVIHNMEFVKPEVDAIKVIELDAYLNLLEENEKLKQQLKELTLPR